VSEDLYPTVLQYSGLAGVAKLNGKRVDLMDNPILCGQRIFHLHYIPRTCYQIRRRPHDAMSEMSHFEIAAADALLIELTTTKGTP